MEDELDIKDLFVALWRKKVLIVIVTILFFVIGMVAFGKQENTTTKTRTIGNLENVDTNSKYVETDFIFSRGNSKTENGVDSSYKLDITSGVITNLNQFATSETFLKKVKSEINFQEDVNVEKLKDNIVIFRNGDSDVISLIVIFDDEEKAGEISEKILEEIKDKIKTLYDIDEIVVIDGPKEIDEDDVKKAETTIKTNMQQDQINGTFTPEETESSSSSKKKVILVTVAGFVLICGIVIIVELFDDTVKNENQVEIITKSNNIVRIPKSNGDLTEKFEFLRASLDGYKLFLVTSPEKQNGKTFVSDNLKKAYEKAGKKAAIVSSKDYEKKIDKLEKENDVVIVDSENILEDGDSLTIAKSVKNILLVTAERETKLDNLKKAKNNIDNIDGKIIGNVLNKSIRK